jgi:Pyruvate/2-oxoacid:ferredoxin oxidoreductase gamma subunit
VVKVLESALVGLGLAGSDVTLVSDIGCSGLFDTFFHTHAFHGLHGRVLTYAAGIKLARPEQVVVATMGDGGVGIGGAHLLAAARRNQDLTLLILDNFNFGMTGGQYSATTPADARVGSGFLNRLEPPLDVAGTLAAAGAPYVVRCSSYDPELPAILAEAVRYDGFAAVEILGICPGRYTRRNPTTPKAVAARVEELPRFAGEVGGNRRPEYGRAYREAAAEQAAPELPGAMAPRFPPLFSGRREVLLLGAAGQRVNTAGELLCLAGMSAGLDVTQKNEYDITVLRGPSVAELILADEPIGYTGLGAPAVVLALAPEGVARRRGVFARLGTDALVLRTAGVEVPDTPARVRTVDLAAAGVKKADCALGMLAALVSLGGVISREMLDAAAGARFGGAALDAARQVIRAAGEALGPEG